jgi:hypothetical protein
MRALASKLLGPEGPGVVCPTGPVPRGSDLPLLVVASFPRSGTHLLIDLILNNLPRYRGRPLYVNLDRYLEAGLDPDALIRAGGMVLKVHHPEPICSAGDVSGYTPVIEAAKVVMAEREPDAVYRSYCAMFGETPRASFDSVFAAFARTWRDRADLVFPIDELTDPARTAAIAAKIATLTGAETRVPAVPPIAKHRRKRVLLSKLGTRLLPGRIPTVNTAIGFAKTPGP